MEITYKFLDEIESKEGYDKIMFFIKSKEFRNGEYESKNYVLKKINNEYFMIYREVRYPYVDAYPILSRDISECNCIYINNFLTKMDVVGKQRGFI